MSAIPKVFVAHVSIHNGVITPKSQHVGLGSQVEFRADADCTIVFTDGSGIVLPLKKGVPGYITMTAVGDHSFEVLYDTAKYAQVASEIHQRVSGTTEATTFTLAMKVSVPTGDILVP